MFEEFAQTLLHHYLVNQTVFTSWFEIKVEELGLGLDELSKGIDFIMDRLINFKATEVQKGEAVVFQDLTLS